MERFFSTRDAPGYIKSKVLYERKPVTDIWNRLTAVAKQQWKWKNFPERMSERGCRILHIYGPPGSGKSSASFYWVWLVCRNCRTKATWISCAAQAGSCWSIDGPPETAGGTVATNIETAIPQTAEDLLHARIVVFDDIRKETLERWRGMMNDLARKGIVVVVVSSEGVRFHDGDSGDIVKLHHFVPSWTLDEYVGACGAADFWRSVCLLFQDGTVHDDVARREQLIKNKFASAGHSARFMFSYTEFETKQRISRDAKAMGGIDSLENAVRNTGSSGAVNTVVARLQADKNGTTPQAPAETITSEDMDAVADGPSGFLPVDAKKDYENAKPLLVSAFASQEVAKNIPSSIERMRNVAHILSNRAIEGYDFEEQFKKSLREAENPGRSLGVIDQNGQRVEYQVNQFISCDSIVLEATLINNLIPNTWIFVGGQQGAFDAIHVESLTRIRFVQITVGQKHTFFLDVVDGLLRRVRDSNIWTHVDFLLLRPYTERHRNFVLDTARGALQPFLRFDGQLWDRQDYRNNVDYKLLEWS